MQWWRIPLCSCPDSRFERLHARTQWVVATYVLSLASLRTIQAIILSFLAELVIIQEIDKANRKFIPMTQVKDLTKVMQITVLP